MANVDVVNTDDDLVTFINSFTVPPTEEEIAENNTLKRSYDVLFNEQDDSISDAPKEKNTKNGLQGWTPRIHGYEEKDRKASNFKKKHVNPDKRH